jgi:hypothetical protein
MVFSRRVWSGVGALLAAAALMGSSAGCGGGGGSGGSGGVGGSGNTGGNGNTGGGGPLAGPCEDLSTRIGGFTVSLIEEMTGNPAHTAFGGGARNRPHPNDVWTQEGTTMNGCKLIAGPSYSCTPACTGGQICGGPNQCVDEPRFQDAGTLTLVGLGSAAITIMPVAPTVPQYSWSPPSTMPLPHPPFAFGINVGLTSTGAAIPALALGGRGIEPLVAGNTNAMFIKGEPFTFTWTAPAQTGPARIRAGMEIAHHGGVAARIECDLPDTGTATIPATLLSALIDKGLFGFPELTIARATYDSVMTSAGCIDFGVVSGVARPLIGCTAAGMCKKSCNNDGDCTPPQTCQTGFVCGP